MRAALALRRVASKLLFFFPMPYVFLFLAIISEVIGTSALAASNQFTKLVPSLITVAGYGLGFYFFSFALKTIPMGVAYAIWGGVGIVLVTIIGFVFLKQKLDFPALAGIALIVIGVLVMQLFSKTVSH
ncbi:DMT family transporter [Hymenobacter bucti]|uniref:DMT family transporter n=1 Tax=Hymenobacter bucti TaxID=1844114 RepID=A0ABW4QPI7_9BACT